MREEGHAASVTDWFIMAFVFAIAASLFCMSCAKVAHAEERGGTGAAQSFADVGLGGDGYGGNIPFSVPTSITFIVRTDGTLIAPDNVYIENHGAARMRVSSVQVAGANGLRFVSGPEQPVGEDAVFFEFGVEGAMLNAASYSVKSSIESLDAWTIEPGEALPLRFVGSISDTGRDIGAGLQFGTIQWFAESDSVDSRSGYAYAVLDADGKLTFFRSQEMYDNDTEQVVRDIRGNEYSGLVFSNVESTPPGYNVAPWRAQGPQVVSVTIADGQEIAPAHTAGWFQGCTDMQSCDLNGLDTSATGNMTGMFENCSSLVSLDLSMLDTSSVESMVGMFRGCRRLASIDVGSFETSSLQNMNSMFCECAALSTLDLSNFDTSRVTNFGSMVYNCTNLEQLVVHGFDTRSAESVNCMFYGCIKLASIDLRGFDMSKVRNAYGMFYDCRGLATIYTDPDADWSALFPEDSSNMFWRCIKLEGGAGTAFISFPNNALRNGKEYARVDGLDGKPGFFTSAVSDALSNDG